MFHHVARARSGEWLFRTELEGRGLWRRVAALDGLVAACRMPDHLHVVLRHGHPSRCLLQVESACTRARNAARGGRGPLWAPAPPPQPLPDELHLRRTVRYVHLDPCRARLVSDPLAWPPG